MSIDRDSVVAELRTFFVHSSGPMCEKRTCTLMAILTQLLCFLVSSEMAMGQLHTGQCGNFKIFSMIDILKANSLLNYN